MNTKPLTESLPDEHILQVDPPLRPSVDAGWRSRPHLYTGRALSAEGLFAEQRQRSGRLALRGQMVAPGVVAGLEVRLESEFDAAQERQVHLFQIAPGLGLTARGEDVVLPRATRVRVDRLLAFWEQGPEGGPKGFDVSILAAEEVEDFPKTHAGLQAAVLVLVPVVAKRDETPAPGADPCEETPDDDAFEDSHLVDGCALVLYAWPSSWPLPERDARWRNRLAWELFERERKRPHGQPAPWEEVGVPLALVGFDPPAQDGEAATPRFIDRAAVVRAGGAPRARTPLVPELGSPLLWQARTQQLAEHLASFTPEQLQNGTALKALAYLPPVGTLPLNAFNVDFGHIGHRRRFFPSGFHLEYVPVPLEQLDAVALASTSLARLDTTKPESVQVLVPVPEAHFETSLLHRERVSPDFQDAIHRALHRLNQSRWEREVLRIRASALRNAIEGEKDVAKWFPEVDPVTEGEQPPPEPNPYEPKTEFHGTQRVTTVSPPRLFVPLLDQALAQNGTWAEPDLLGADNRRVATAVSADGNFGVVTMGLHPFGYHLLSLRRSQELRPELITYYGHSVDCVLVWSGPEPVVVVLSRHTMVSTVTPWRKQGTHWTSLTGQSMLSTTTTVLGFTAVCWKPGCIDVFVATSTGLQKFTWINDSSQAEGTEVVSTRYVTQVVALSPEPGRIELLYLAKESEANPGEPWIHHISALHENDSPKLSPAGGTALSAREVTALKGTQLTACVSSTEPPTAPPTEPPTESQRIDVLVMGTGGIRHGWFVESWKSGMELVSTTNNDAVVVVSAGDKQVHAYWWERPDRHRGMTYARLLYRRYDGTRWHPPEFLGLHSLNLPAPLGAIIQEASPHIFLASTSGLLRLKKVAESTRKTVKEVGLKGLIENVEGLYQETVTFISQSSKQVQQELQHMRQLMITSSTEASRLAVSASQGSTLVDSPLVVSADVDGYLTGFRTRAGRGAYVRLSDAMEALEEATTIRLELTTRLLDLVKRIVGVKEIGLDVTNLFLVGIAKVTDPPGVESAELIEGTKTVKRERFSLRELVDRPDLVTSVLKRIDQEPENIRRALALKRMRWTESLYFSTALQHLENTLSLLLALERRLRTRVNFMEGYKVALAGIKQYSSELDTLLKIVDGKVAEARQDVTVAHALLEEEKVRVDGINTRRQQVLLRHVPFFVYQRPRHQDLTREAAHRLLDTGIVRDILPEVLTSTAAAPPELLAYVELVRDSPLQWFSLAPTLLGGLDRLEYIHRTFLRAQSRAAQRLPVRYPIFSGRAASPYVQSLSRLLGSREELIARQRGAFVHFQPSYLYSRTWLELQQAAHEQLSLGDLIDTSHGRPDVSEAASNELKQLGRVATGLYQRFGELLPSLRLEWADQLSQYDAPVNLRDLSRLPKWEQVEVMDRRELQLLVDWLFQRVVSARPEAVSLINDLVRVCMLLASHAPVNELLSGHVSVPTMAKAGGMLELAVDPDRVRIGMYVLIRSGQQSVQAVVEDISPTAVRARVLSTSTPTVHLPERASARFGDPARGGSALPHFMSEAW